MTEILAVDDEMINRMIIADVLGPAGYESTRPTMATPPWT